MSIKEHPPQQHVPVLLNDVVKLLNPQPGESYLDLTAGYGGHATAILSKTENPAGTVLVDRDEYAATQLGRFGQRGTTVLNDDFVSAAQQLVVSRTSFDMILVDLGVSSPQLDQSDRGFSFQHDGPLDMRMDRRQTLSADTLVNQASKQELERIIGRYGEEPLGMTRRIVDAIVRQRPVRTTKQLADIILGIHRGKWQKTHPATRTFQAFRIAVNDELGQIEALLPLIPTLLGKGGRVAFISFHSLEDRIIKRFFKEQFDAGYEAILAPVTKKPVDGKLHDVHNPRSRSAKLRVAVKK